MKRGAERTEKRKTGLDDMDPSNNEQTEPARVSSSDRSSEAETETSSSKPWASGRVLTAAQRARKRAIDKQSNRERRNRTQARIAELESKLETLLRDRAMRGGTEMGPQMGFAHEGDLQRLGQVPRMNPSSPWDVPSAAGAGTWNYSQPGHMFPQAQPLNYAPGSFLPDYNPITSRENIMDSTAQNILTPPGLLLPPAPSQHFPNPSVTQDMPANPPGIAPATHETTNTTRLCNQLLSKARLLNRSQICLDAATTQNILIRGVMQGWDRVESSVGYYCPLWKMLREIDDLLFCTSSDTTRLVMLSTIHRMLLVQVERQSYKALPPWYRPRPAQCRFQHDLVVSYFAWPGLRERLVLSEKTILSDTFWLAFTRLFRFYWPYSSSEVYQVTNQTGKIQFSGAFMNYIQNIQNWRMDHQFFTNYPELYDDIIPAPAIPRTIGAPGASGAYVRSQPRPNPQPASTVPAEEEVVPPGYQSDVVLPLSNLSIQSQDDWGLASQDLANDPAANWDPTGHRLINYKPS